MWSKLRSTANVHKFFVALSLIVFYVLFVGFSNFNPLVVQAKALVESSVASAGMLAVARTASKDSSAAPTIRAAPGTRAPIMQQYGNESIETGLAGYWKMDESSWVGDCNTKSVLDSSGNNNNAKACPNGSAPQPGLGRNGNAAVLDGSNDYLQVTNDASLYGFSAMSVAAWVYLDPIAISQGHNIVGKSNVFSGGYRIGVDTMGKLNWLIGASGSETLLVSINNLPTGQWVFVTGVYDGSNMNLYINDTLAAPAQAKSGTVQDSGTDLYFGTYENGVGTNLWKGDLDEVRIYNRALSDAEITQLYNESPQPRFYLPLVTSGIACGDFFDNFSDPNSGWPVSDTSTALREYRDGEYRILSKQSGFLFLSKSPACDHYNYFVDVDARWVTTTGNSYGLLFGVVSDFSQYYLFDMNTDVQQYRLLRRNAGGGFTTIAGPTPSSAIKAGLATNHLQARRLGSQITLYVNGTWLGDWTDGMIGGRTGTGVVASAYSVMPSADARFDNFAMVAPPAPMQSQSNSVAPATTGVRSESEIMNESIPRWK
jgi:hypothetical protein